MKKLFPLLFIFLSLNSLAQEEVTITSNDIKLYGTLLHPKKAKSMVILISGSGNTDRNGNSILGQIKLENNSLKMVAEKLYENEIASLRYDKRGTGKSINSKFNENDIDFDNYVTDLTAWINFLTPKYDKIILAGHSQGALVAILAAQQVSIDKIICLAGQSISGYLTIKNQLSEQPKFVSDQAIPILDEIYKGNTVDSIPQYLMVLFRPRLQNFLKSYLPYNPKEEIQKLNIPALIIQGTTDIQIAVDDTEHLAKSYKKAQFVLIEGMNHILKKSVADRNKNFETYKDPDEPIHSKLMNPILDFINE